MNMKRFSLIAAAVIALSAPAVAAPVSSVGSGATLSPSGGTWSLNAQAVRESRLRAQSQSIYRERNRFGGVRSQDPNTPIYSIGQTRGLGQLFGSGSNSGSALFSGASGSNFGQTVSTSVSNSGGGSGGFDIMDLIPSNGGSALTPVTSISAVPVPATLPLLLGGFGLLAFMRRRA